jgi:hypothetical protein
MYLRHGLLGLICIQIHENEKFQTACKRDFIHRAVYGVGRDEETTMTRGGLGGNMTEGQRRIAGIGILTSLQAFSA